MEAKVGFCKREPNAGEVVLRMAKLLLAILLLLPVLGRV